MSIGSDTVMTVALDSHQIPYYLPGKKPFVPYFRYSVKDKYSIKGEEMQEGKKYYENKKTRCVGTSFCYIILFILSERNSVLDVLLYICDRHSFLLHRVTFTDCYAAVLNTVEVVCDAEGSTDLVLSSVSLTDSACIVIVNAEVL